MGVSTWNIVATFETEYPADSVEWCPHPPYQSFFICGTYFLLEDKPAFDEPQTRIGSILLMNVNNGRLEECQKIRSLGVLDAKWCPYHVNNEILLAVATAIGEVSIYMFRGTELQFKVGINVREEDVGDYMTLSLNWFEYSEGRNEGLLCCSDNKGHLAVIKLDESGLNVMKKWGAHDLEAWTVAFALDDENVLFSGGDDAKLKTWDTRSPEKVNSNSAHNSGVTVINTDTGSCTTILVGSFDETVSFYDPRKLKTPIEMLKCSGGIWRIKCLDNFILTANIYGGFQIIDRIDVPKIIGNYTAHDSLAYGADWSLLSKNSVSSMYKLNRNGYLVGSCSFYDKKLTISTFEPGEPLT